MRSFLKNITVVALSVAACAALSTPAFASPCSGSKTQQTTQVAPANPAATTATIKTVTVEEVATHIDAVNAKKTGVKAIFAVDANNDNTRSNVGTIPNAILLSSVSNYDASKVLPTDKNAALVFYCANEKCSASKTAAQRAVEAGYTDVAVLPVGISGWVSAGKTVAKVAAPAPTAKTGA